MGDFKTDKGKIYPAGNAMPTCQALAVAETAPQVELQERAACLMDHYQKAIAVSYGKPVAGFNFSFRFGGGLQNISCGVREEVVHLDSQNALYGGLFTFDCERQITDGSQKERKILETYEVGNLYVYPDPEMRDLPSSTPAVVSGESRITYSSLKTESSKK